MMKTATRRAAVATTLNRTNAAVAARKQKTFCSRTVDSVLSHNFAASKTIRFQACHGSSGHSPKRLQVPAELAVANEFVLRQIGHRWVAIVSQRRQVIPT